MVHYRKLPKGTQLFRYNLGVNLPKDWSSDYKSIEYQDSVLGPKNQVGALFFYDNETTACQVLSSALSKRQTPPIENTITSCFLLEDVVLLDLSQCEFPTCVLRILRDEGIDILTNDYVRHDQGCSLFSELKDDFLFMLENDNVEFFPGNGALKVYNAANRINDFFHYSKVGIRYIGQLLTDFENGNLFKTALLEKGFDGYCFTEEPSPTICIFDASKITPPTHNRIPRLTGLSGRDIKSELV